MARRATIGLTTWVLVGALVAQAQPAGGSAGAAQSQPAASQPAAASPTPTPRPPTISVELNGLTEDIQTNLLALAKAYLDASVYSDSFVVRMTVDVVKDNQPTKQVNAMPGTIHRVQGETPKLAIRTATHSLFDNGTSVVAFDATTKTYRHGVAPKKLSGLIGMSPEISQVLALSPHIGLLITPDPTTVLLGGYQSITRKTDELIQPSDLGFKTALECAVYELRMADDQIVTTIRIDKKTNLLRSMSTDLTKYFTSQLSDKKAGAAAANLMANRITVDVDILSVDTSTPIPESAFQFVPERDFNQLPLEGSVRVAPTDEGGAALSEEEYQALIGQQPADGKPNR